jgi:cell pole-organizing protein PopZ
VQQADDPSVGEILASIRKVMARDSHALATGAPVGQPPAQHGGDDILELTQTVDAEGVAAPPPPARANVATEPPLLADERSASMRESLNVLAMLADPQARAPGAGDASLQRLTRELLRPMLKEWLDANLPAMVERMVAAEIARLVGQRD